MSPKHQHLDLSDARAELRRITARSASKPNHRSLLNLLEGDASMDNAYMAILKSLLTSEEEADSREVRTKPDDGIELMERPSQVKKGKRITGIIEQPDEDDSRKVKTEYDDEETESDDIRHLTKRPLANDGLQPIRFPNNHVIRVKQEHEARVKLANRSKGKACGKGKGVVKQEHEADEKKPEVKKENVKSRDRISGTRRVRRGEGSSMTVPEVIVLDSDSEETESPYVSSKKHRRSMADEEFDFGDNVLKRKTDSGFKKELLEVLRKPFDKAELKRRWEAFKSGLYHRYHPDVKRRLKKYRYKREKCLIILREFMFWLQNVSREGVFQPWKDKRYINLELPSS